MVHTAPGFLLTKQHAREQQAAYIGATKSFSKCIQKGTRFTVMLCIISGLFKQKGSAAAALYQSSTRFK